MRTIVVPLVAVAVAWGLQLLLDAMAGLTPLVVLHAATAASTWLAGSVAGVLAAALTFLIGERWFFADSLFETTDARAIVQAIVFWIAAAAIISSLTVLRAALARASRGASRTDRLTTRVRRRNAEFRRAAARYRALSEVAAALMPALSPRQVREIVLGRGAVAAEATVAVLVTLDGGRLDVGCGGECPEGLGEAIAGTDVVGGVLGGGAVRWLEASDMGSAIEERSGCDLWAVLPLSTRERRIGALVLGYASAEGLTETYRTIAELLAQQCAQALERARLHDAERSLRVQAQFAERQMGFLAVSSAALSATLDLTRSLAEVADLAATNLGGFCAIHLVDRPGGRPELIAGSFTSETGLVRFGGDEARYTLADDSPWGYPAVLASGKPELLRELTPAMIEEAAATPQHAARLNELGLRAQICVPLEVRDTVLGAITVATTAATWRLADAEMNLAEHLARRVAQAVDAATQYRTAVQASRAKSSFLAVMSHELRTPLNAILGYADLILMGVPAKVSEETRHQVERIRYSAAHLLELVEDVLSFARAEAGRDRVQVEAVLIRDVVAEAIGMVEPLAAAKRLELRQSVPEGAAMSTDRAKVVRILHNLLSNAAKFTQSGHVEVEAALDGNTVIVAVRDTGIGIDPANRERIFDPFWQVEQTPTRRHGGTGIGLGIARQLARLLGGDVRVDSEIGKGSTFTLRLPARFEALPPARV